MNAKFVLEKHDVKNVQDSAETKGVILCGSCRATVLGVKYTIRGFVPSRVNGGKCDCLSKRIEGKIRIIGAQQQPPHGGGET